MTNELFFKNLFQDSTFGVIVYNQDLNVLYVNEMIYDLTGLSKEKVYGTLFFNLCVEEKKHITDIMVKLNNGFDRAFDEYIIQIKDKMNKIVILDLAGFPYKHGERSYLIVFVQNITKRITYEKVLDSSFDNLMRKTIDLDAAYQKIIEQQAVLESYQLKMKQELNIAKNVQRAIIPKEFLRNEYIDVWGICLPSQELGGDYFDFFNLDDSKLGILIADVSGHGLPSALITTMIKAYFERFTKIFIETNKVFDHINREIIPILQDTGFYFTSFYSILDLDTMIITSTSAGHDLAICYNPKSDEFHVLGKTEKGAIIGAFEEAEYDSSKFQLEEGSKVILYTDGITEARNTIGDFFGQDRILNLIRQNIKLRPKELIEKIIAEINLFYNGASPNDDRTMIILEVIKIPQTEELSFDQKDQIIERAYKNGRVYLNKRQYKAAFQEFKKILKFDPYFFGAYGYLGHLYYLFGDYAKAEENLKIAIELDDAFRAGYYSLGLVYYKQKKFSKAKECWLELKKLDPNFRNINEYLKQLEDID